MTRLDCIFAAIGRAVMRFIAWAGERTGIITWEE